MKKLKFLLSALYKNVAVIMIITSICVIASIGYVFLYTTPKYTSTSELLIHNGDLVPTSAQYENASTDVYLGSITEILNSYECFKFFADTYGTSENFTPEELSHMIKTTQKDKNSLVFYITTSADDAELAKTITTDFTYNLSRFLSGISPKLTTTVLTYGQDATVNREGTVLIILGSIICGLIVSSLFILIMNSLNLSLKGVSDYKEKYSVRLLGTVPDFEAVSKGAK